MAWPAVFGVRISVGLTTKIFNIMGILSMIGSWINTFFGFDSQDNKFNHAIDNITRILLSQNNALIRSLFPNNSSSISDIILLDDTSLPIIKSDNSENNFRNLFLLLYKAITGSNMTPDNENPDLWADSSKIMQFPISGFSPFFDAFDQKFNDVVLSLDSLQSAFYIEVEPDVILSISQLFDTKESSVDFTDLIDVFKITINETDYNITDVLKNILTISENPDFSDNIASGFLAVGSRAVDEVAKAF